MKESGYLMLRQENFQQYKTLYHRSITEPENFWGEMAMKFISWSQPWEETLRWDYTKAYIEWFQGGKTNICFNSVDRHLPDHAQKIAIIHEGNEPGAVEKMTYAELHQEICRFANGLKKIGVVKGDRVAIYMPMLPQAAVAMLACARIGAVHSVVFAGFSAESLRDRLDDLGCKILITADVGFRGAKIIPLKAIVNDALTAASSVEQVIVFANAPDDNGLSPNEISMQIGRDVWMHDFLKDCSSICPCEEMDSEDPLFVLYTSGSTGKPKGVLHTTGGYAVYAAVTHKFIFDLQPDDIFFCAADIGWITGHSYVVYGPLLNGVTTVMFESIPNYPDAGRYWDVIQRVKATIFYTAPTAIRLIAKEGPELPKHYDLSSLRVLGAVGEPINPDAWHWYSTTVGNDRCPVVDTWWQTETGGILISPIAFTTETKPGSATLPFFGIQPVIVDDDGNELTENNVTGKLCIKFPWPGQMRTVYNNHQRFFDTYFSMYPGMYFTGDACSRDADGYYWIIGRVDDVLNVAGHRLGTAEIESAIIASQLVAEAAVIGVPHEIKGTGIFAFCVLKNGVDSSDKTKAVIVQRVRSSIGGFAVPDAIVFVPGLPKTRSGKIMRRILRKIVEGDIDGIGDTSTLAEPTIVRDIVSAVEIESLYLQNT